MWLFFHLSIESLKVYFCLCLMLNVVITIQNTNKRIKIFDTLNDCWCRWFTIVKKQIRKITFIWQMHKFTFYMQTESKVRVYIESFDWWTTKIYLKTRLHPNVHSHTFNMPTCFGTFSIIYCLPTLQPPCYKILKNSHTLYCRARSCCCRWWCV